MDAAYVEQNRREYELTKHVLLRQLDPLALLALKATGACDVTLPEWPFDLDCPGHYLRRIRSVGFSIPCVVGPYASVNCTASLYSSTVRYSPLVADGYARDGTDALRFVDRFGAIQSVVGATGFEQIAVIRAPAGDLEPTQQGGDPADFRRRRRLAAAQRCGQRVLLMSYTIQ